MLRKSLTTAAATLIAGTFVGCSGADTAKVHDAADKAVQAATEARQAMTETPKSAQLAKFDFGTPESILRAGFTRVTAADAFAPERGWGFESVLGLTAYDRGGAVPAVPKDALNGDESDDARTTADITCDLIEGEKDNAFLVALPDGEYTVWVVAGDPDWEPPLFEIWANGRKALDVRIPRRAFVFEESFEACAAGGVLRIEMKGPHGWVLNGLVIGPKGPELDAVVAKMHREVFFATDEVAPHWKQVKVAPCNPPMEWTAAEREKGYVLFPIDYTEQILPCDEPARAAALKAQAMYTDKKLMRFVPERAMIGQPMTAFATPGEFEPAFLCLSAMNDLGNVHVELSDFVEEKSGAKIGRANVTAGVVRCLPRRMSGWGPNRDYIMEPTSIEPLSGALARVVAGQVKQYWLTVHVPEGASPGQYRMSVTVRPEKSAPSTVEWRLLVLPFQLSRPADKHWGTWLDWFPPVGVLRGSERRGRNVPSEVDRLAKADMADYRDHGFDLVIANYYFGAEEKPDGTFVYDVSALARDMEYFRTLGRDVPVVVMFEYACRAFEEAFATDKPHVAGTFSPKARQAVLGLVRHIRDEAQRLNWPKIYYFPIDEPGNNSTANRIKFAKTVLDVVHEVPGCETAVTVSGAELQELGEERVDVRIYSSYNREKAIEDSKRGHPFWYYDNSMMYGRNMTISRAGAGFGYLRSGADVCTGWGFSATVGNPHCDFDARQSDFNIIFPGLDAPTPTIYWELCREGVDDVRYVTTLQEQNRLAKESGRDAEAQRAEQALKPVLDADGPGVYDNPLEFGRLRWRVAREMLGLTGHAGMALTFPAVIESAAAQRKFAPNAITEPSFESGPQADGFPAGDYAMGDTSAKTQEKPIGAVRVSEEAAHSGRYSIKFDFSQAAGKGVLVEKDRPRSLIVTATVPPAEAAKLQGKFFKCGLWYRAGGGAVVPDVALRLFLKGKFMGHVLYPGGVADPAGWNYFDLTTNERIPADCDGLTIQIACEVPDDPEVAAKSSFFVDDLSLHAVEDPPVAIETDLDEYYIGEAIPWTLKSEAARGPAMVALIAEGTPRQEQPCAMESATLNGSTETRGLRPGVYTLRATVGEQSGERQIIIAPNPFSW